MYNEFVLNVETRGCYRFLENRHMGLGNCRCQSLVEDRNGAVNLHVIQMCGVDESWRLDSKPRDVRDLLVDVQFFESFDRLVDDESSSGDSFAGRYRVGHRRSRVKDASANLSCQTKRQSSDAAVTVRFGGITQTLERYR